MKSQSNLIVSVSLAYGREIFTPQCPGTRLFAELLGQKTLTRENIEVIKKLGYEVRIQEVIL